MSHSNSSRSHDKDDKNKCAVTLCKKLIYTSAEYPSETDFLFDLEGNIIDDVNVDIKFEKKTIKSNMTFAFTLVVTNNLRNDIFITSCVDSLLTVNNNCLNVSSYINFARPTYSENGICLNRCFRKNGELVDNQIRLCSGKVGEFTFRGCVNSRRLSINNFAILKYSVCDSDHEYIVRSNDESFVLEN